MGYAIMFAPCFTCDEIFGFNPIRVPSLMVEGERRPICLDCHTQLNELREQKGVPKWPPPHADAYSPVNEHELG